jgi:hypothetical protein
MTLTPKQLAWSATKAETRADRLFRKAMRSGAPDPNRAALRAGKRPNRKKSGRGRA